MTIHQTHKLADIISDVLKLETAGKLAEAEEKIGQALEALPQHAHVNHIAGLIAYKRQKFLLALRLGERSLELAPQQQLYFRNICEIYRSNGDIASAAAAAKTATELLPADPAGWFNRALIATEELHYSDAVKFASTAINLKPDYVDAKFLLAEIHLLFGNPRTAWNTYEERFNLPQAKGMLPQSGKPQWKGEPLRGDQILLVVADQGFGDCIQFSRYLPKLLSLVPNAKLACSSELVPLLSQFRGLAQISTNWNEIGHYDTFVPLSSLPAALDPDLEEIPTPGGYLDIPARHKVKWAARLDELCPKGKRVAIVWAGRPEHKNDRKRSLPLRAFAPLLEAEGLCIVSVQKGPQAVQASGWKGPLIDLSPEIDTFLDTGAILQSCDCLVSVDTSVVHLAGALGVQTHMLLPFNPDWRWREVGEQSPWYKGLRLWRQGRPYDWGGVVEGVAKALAQPAGQANLPGFP